MRQRIHKLKMEVHESQFILRFKNKISFLGPTGAIQPFTPLPAMDTMDRVKPTRRSSLVSRRKTQLQSKQRSKETISHPNKQNTYLQQHSRPSSGDSCQKLPSCKSLVLPRIRAKSYQGVSRVKQSLGDQSDVASIPSIPSQARVRKDVSKKQPRVYIHSQCQTLELQRPVKKPSGLRI